MSDFINLPYRDFARAVLLHLDESNESIDDYIATLDPQTPSLQDIYTVPIILPQSIELALAALAAANEPGVDSVGEALALFEVHDYDLSAIDIDTAYELLFVHADGFAMSLLVGYVTSMGAKIFELWQEVEE